MTVGAGRRPPGWLPLTTMALAAAGLAVSVYLTYEHFTASTTLSCPNTGALNCEKVTSSAQSKLFGAPVAVLGLLYFVLMILAVTPWAWAVTDRRLRGLATLVRLGGAGGGVCFVLYLVYAELFIINSICLWCTAVHVLTIALFGVIAVGTALTAPALTATALEDGSQLGPPGSTAG